MNGSKKRNSFVVEIIDTQNKSWQGNLTWVEKGEKIPFRSTLEMIKLMDSAIETEEQQ